MSFALHSVGDGYSTEAKLMGRQAVGKSLFRAIARRWPDGEVFGFGRGASRAMMDQLQQEGFSGRLVWREQGSTAPPPGFPGTVYHPGPIPLAMAHDRNREGPGAYSLFGVTHTLSSLGAMDSIGDLAGAPFQPWDALICTSTAAVTLVRSLMAERRAWLAEHYGVRAALINPAVRPAELWQSHLGHNQNFYSGRRYEITAEHVEQLRQLDVPVLRHPENLMLLVQTGDETLDYRLAVDKYKSSVSIIQPGGNHSFVNFELMLPDIIRFLSAR